MRVSTLAPDRLRSDAALCWLSVEAAHRDSTSLMGRGGPRFVTGPVHNGRVPEGHHS